MKLWIDIAYRQLHMLLSNLAQILSRAAGDSLLNAMDTGHVNIVHALTDRELQLETDVIRAINDHFLAVRDYLTDEGGNETYPFFIRSYSAWRNAVKLWASGSLPESYTLLRNSLENTAQGHRLRIAGTDLFEQWINRHAFNNHRNVFTFKKALQSIEPNFAQIMDILHSISIDMGAHPNPLGTLTGVRTSSEGNLQVLYQGATQHEMLSLADYLALAGICALQIYKHCYSAAYKSAGVEQSLALLTLKVIRIVDMRQNLRDQAKDGSENNDLGWITIIREDRIFATAAAASAINPNVP